TYSGNVNQYLIEVAISPFAYKNFNFKVDKGDLIGVQIISSLSGISTLPLTVGESYHYQYFTGNITLSSDVTILLDTNPATFTNGNEFKIHFDAVNVNLNGYRININAGASLIKSLGPGDFYQMKNIDGGIIISLKSNGSTWYVSQNYDLGIPGELKQVVGLNGVSATSYFDANGWGNVQGLYGYHIANGSANTLDLRGRFIVGHHPGDSDYTPIGKTGGVSNITLSLSNIPLHDHVMHGKGSITGGSGWLGRANSNYSG